MRSFEIVRHVRDLNPSVPRRLLHRVRNWTTLDRLVTAMSIDFSIQLAEVHVRRRQRREEQQRIDDEDQRVAARKMGHAGGDQSDGKTRARTMPPPVFGDRANSEISQRDAVQE
jgi:hypothetical protein